MSETAPNTCSASTCQTVVAGLRRPATAGLLCMGLFSIFESESGAGHAAGLPGRNSRPRVAPRGMKACLQLRGQRPHSQPSSSGLTGRSSIPETSVMESISRGVLDILVVSARSVNSVARSYGVPPSTSDLNTRRTSACVSLTRASSEEKSGASPARAITRNRSSPAVSGLKRSLTQSRRIWVRS